MTTGVISVVVTPSQFYSFLGDGTPSAEISITARINDLSAWNSLPNIRRGICMSNKDKWMVTAQVPLSMIDELKKSPFIESLKFSQPVSPTRWHKSTSK
jgi:hypothetical protein